MDGEKAPAAQGRKLWKQEEIDQLYNGVKVQVLVAFLIGGNFLINMIEKQIDPAGTKHAQLFAGLDLFFNIAFLIELAVNIYAHWFCAFWQSSWNIFDFVVVSIGVINMLKLPLPPALNLLRLMRAFRVFRLFKRVKSLNKIIVSIAHAVPGVLNALLILTIVMSIYAILAVEFYQDAGMENCDNSFDTSDPLVARIVQVEFKSPRQFCWGNEYFGSFSKSIYSFFQVLTGESWSEMVARPAIWYYYDKPFKAVASAMFFVSFVIVTGFVLMNVVVAVLLDKMSSQDDSEEPTDGTTAPETVEEDLSEQELNIHKNFQQVAKSLEQFAEKQAAMQKEFDRTRADIAATKEQIGMLAKVFG